MTRWTVSRWVDRWKADEFIPYLRLEEKRDDSALKEMAIYVS